MPIDCMYRDAGSVGLSELPQLHSRLPVHSCLMMSKPPPPPGNIPVVINAQYEELSELCVAMTGRL